jgi:P pilus assembly chaperone PapD
VSLATRFFSASAVFVLACAASLAHADSKIRVGNLYEYIPGKTASITKTIRNDGDATGFVRVEIKRISYDAAGKDIETDQPADGSLNSRLIVSPNRLIVPAQGARSVRLLYTGARDTEQYFRVRFTPVLPDRNDGFDVSAETEKAFASAGVKVMVGYGAVVVMRPSNEIYDTQVETFADHAVITNRGNSTVIIDNFFECSESGNKCQNPVKKHVLPGRHVDYYAKSKSSIKFEIIEGDRKQEKSIQFSSASNQ